MLLRRILIAEKVARSSDCTVKHGALIFKSGRILSSAANRKVTHPESFRWSADPKKLVTIHAEQRALILSRTSLRGATLVSVRLNGNKCSKPCPMCAALMRDAGIAHVIYFDGVKYVREKIRW
jgi:deoxycytidylate deaminase